LQGRPTLQLVDNRTFSSNIIPSGGAAAEAGQEAGTQEGVFRHLGCKACCKGRRQTGAPQASRRDNARSCPDNGSASAAASARTARAVCTAAAALAHCSKARAA